MSTDYDPLVHDYHWLVSDALLSGESFIARHRPLLSALPLDARVLDCACGIGSDAIGLARAGFQVTASDSSAAFVAEAERRAQAVGVTIRFAVCQWDNLPQRFAAPFDLVLCVGNSISHALNHAALVRALSGMHAVLKPGGSLLVDTRNWEKSRREQPRMEVAERVVEREEMRCVPIYLWQYESEWDATHHVEMLLIFERVGQVSARRYVLSYRPIRYEELLGCLQEGGFAITASDYGDNAERYEIEACRKPD